TSSVATFLPVNSLLTVNGWKIRLVPPGSSAPMARTPPVTRGIRSPLGKLATALIACTWPWLTKVISKSMSLPGHSSGELAPYDWTTSSGRPNVVGAGVFDGAGVEVGPTIVRPFDKVSEVELVRT